MVLLGWGPLNIQPHIHLIYVVGIYLRYISLKWLQEVFFFGNSRGCETVTLLGTESHGNCRIVYTPKKLTWNPTKMVVCGCVSFSKGAFLGSMLIFEGCASSFSFHGLYT